MQLAVWAYAQLADKTEGHGNHGDSWGERYGEPCYGVFWPFSWGVFLERPKGFQTDFFAPQTG
jgi:hypothetical protein